MFQILMAESMERTVSWDVASSGLVEMYRRFTRPDGRCNKHLWNVGKFLPDYAA
jgi:hypothetical protein